MEVFQKIAIVVGQFNEIITERLLEGALERLIDVGILADKIEVYKVPGAVEIPLIAQQLAQKKIYGSIIALGCVIQGETDHYDYVCQQVSHGCQQVALTYNVPVIFGVLTTHTVEQALERSGGSEGHKGCESAEAALHMMALMKNLKEES